MKIKESFSNITQSTGLALINGVSRFGRARRGDLTYGNDSRQGCDTYHHPFAGERPAVIFFYGGAWQTYSKRHFQFVGETLVEMGYDAYIPDYRIYPQVKFNEIYDDVQAAARMILEQIGEQPVFLMGHSAGAHMAALLTLRADIPAHANLQGFIGMSGPYDYYPYTEDHHWDLFGPEERYPESHVINFVNASAPPLYLLHGSDDTRVRRGHSKSLMEKQQAVGGKAAREVYENMGHVDMILSFTAFHRKNNPVVRDVKRFIDDTLTDSKKRGEYRATD